MAQDKITEVFDIPQIEKNIQDTLSSIKAMLPELKKIGEELKSSTSIGSSGQNTQAANAAMAEFTKNLKDYTEAVKQAANAKLRQMNVSDEDAAKQKVNAAVLNAQLKEEVKLTSNLTSAYDKLNAQHKQAIKAYQDAAAAGKLSAQQLVVMKDKANELGQQLVKIDSAVGNYRRNVGNYSSAWSGLGNSINQISRELPNFAQSMQLGILAISNNLPILQDELIRARQNIAAMKAEGKDVPSLFSQIASAVISWQTAMTIGISLLLAYSKEIAKFAQSVKEGIFPLTDAEKYLRLYNETLKDSTATKGAIADIERLSKTFELSKKNVELKKVALDDYNKTVGKVMGETNDWATAEQRLIDKAPDFIRVTALKATATEAYSRAAVAEIEILQKLASTGGDASVQDFLKNGFLSVGSKAEQNALEKIVKTYDEYKKIGDSALEQSLLLSKQSGLNYGDAPKGRGGGRVSQIKKETEQISKDLVDIYTQVQNQLNDFEQDEIEIRSRSLAYLRKQLDEGLIGVAQYENEKKIIIKNSEEEILRNQTIYLGKTLANYGFSAENTAKITELWQNKMIDLKKKQTEAEEAEVLISAKNLEAFQDAMYKNKEKKDREQAEREKRIQEEKNRYIQQIAQETNQLIFTLLDAQTQKEIAAAEKRSEAIAAEYDLKRSAIDQASISDEEKTAQKLVLDAEEAESQKKIDNEIRALKIKQAKFDKAQALASIAINAAVAVSANLAPPTLGALTPIILGLAAAQAAVVLATPLPEYAKGKKASDSYEGLAIAGEKGTEMMIDKDGRIQMLTEPTLIHTRRGDTILSNEQLKKGAAEKYAPTKSDYSELVKAYSYNTERTVKAIREIPASIIFDNSVLKLNQKRASR